MGSGCLTVSKLDESRVLIVLGEVDMSRLSLEAESFDFRDTRQRDAILSLTKNACAGSGIETDGRRMNIEALSLGQSFYLLVTVSRRQRVYRRKRDGGLCCSFENAGDLQEASLRLCRAGLCCEKASVYRLGSRYYLLLDYPALPAGAARVLSEYGTLRRGALRCAALRERGIPVCERDALRRIGTPLL